jgi:hypothetical protein
LKEQLEVIAYLLNSCKAKDEQIAALQSQIAELQKDAAKPGPKKV